MRCSICGGRVEWQGPLSNLTHTECLDCGEQNCQEPEHYEDDGLEAEETDEQYDDWGFFDDMDIGDK